MSGELILSPAPQLRPRARILHRLDQQTTRRFAQWDEGHRGSAPPHRDLSLRRIP